MHARFLTTTALLLAVVLLFAVNIVSNALLGGMRVDLTENKLYTLSQGTHNILASLDEPVTLRLYISKGRISSIPSLSGYAKRVESMLAEYERLSDARLIVSTIDPEPFSEEEDRAVAYGMRGLPTGGDEHLYFGIVGTNAVGAEESIPLLSLQRELFLEYDLTRLIYKLTDAKRTVVGLLTSLPIEGGEPATGGAFAGAGTLRWTIVDQMRQLFDLRTLPLELTEVSPEIDVLLLIHPQGLADAALYAIDQYVLRGGKLLAFVDGHAELQPQAPPTGAALASPPGRRSQIDKLLTAWGLALAPDTVVADVHNAVTVQMQQGDGVVSFDYPLWLNISPEHFNRDDPVTAELGNVTFGSAGLLSVDDGATSATQPRPKITSLIRTSAAPAVFSQAQLAAAARDPRQLLNEYQALTAAFNLAVRISGAVGSAFAAPPAATDSSATATSDAAPRAAAHLDRSLSDVNVIVVADADMLSDRFWVQVQDVFGTRIAIPSAANGAFLINALDNLAGSSDLISIRSRGRFTRPFDRIDALRRQTERFYRDKELELAQQLEETENNLVRLEDSNQSAIAGVLSAEQQQELQVFREQRLRIRGELREVRLALRRSIKSLEDRLKFINIGLVPLLIGIGGLGIGAWRLRKRRMRAQIA